MDTNSSNITAYITNHHTARRYGWKRQLPDRRDQLYQHDSSSKGLPDAFDLRDSNLMPPVYSQGHLGSCTANAIAAAFEYNERKAGYGDRDEFTPSRLFIYYNERAMEGSVPTDSGAAIRDGIKSINRTGVCPETQWPYDINKFTEKPPLACYEAAQHERALQYRAVDQSIAAVKRALHDEQQPVVFGFTVYESFESEQVAETGLVPMPEPQEKMLGGHAVLCVGYLDDEEVFLVRNSWGESWGIDGYFKMPYAFLTDPNLASDFWIVETISRVPAVVGELAYASMFPALPCTEEEKVCTSSTQEMSDTNCTSDNNDGVSAAPALCLTGTWAEDGGTTHRAGSAVKITWKTVGTVSRVKLQYCLHSWTGMFSSWSTIVESVANHGSYRWRIPAETTPDTRYWLQVLSEDDSSVYCDSTYFSVEAPEYCSITTA